MKKIFFILSFFISAFAEAQTIYIPAKPDSLFVPVQIGGSVRKVYVTDLIKNKQRQNTYNVLDYGADNTGVADATTAINNAITAAASTHGRVTIPKGTFKVTTIAWNPSVEIIGAGMNQTHLKSYSAVPMFQRSNTATVDYSAAKVGGLWLDGNSIGTIGLDLRGPYNFSFDNLLIQNFTAIGIQIRAVVGAAFNLCLVTNCPKGVYATSVTQSTAGFIPPNLITFNYSAFNACSTWGLDWDNGAGLQLNNCDFEQDGAASNANTGAIHISRSSGAGEGVGSVINGCWFERNYGTAVYYAAASGLTRHIIQNTLIQFPGSGTSTGVYVNQATGATQNVFISGSTISGHTTDVLTDGALAATQYLASTIGTHSQTNSGTFSSVATSAQRFDSVLLFSGTALPSGNFGISSLDHDIHYIVGGKEFRVAPFDSITISDVDAAAYINSFTTAGGTLTTGQQSAIVAFFGTVKTAGIYTKILEMWNRCSSVGAAAAIGMKGVQNTTWANSPTFSSTGVSFNGTTQYGDLGFVPSAAPSYTNNISMGMYLETPSNTTINMGAKNNANTAAFAFTARYSDGNGYFDAYDVTAGSGRVVIAVSDGSGFFIQSLTASNALSIYRNGTSIGSSTTTRTGTPPTISIYIGANHNIGGPNNYGTPKSAFDFIAQGLTSSEAATFSTAVNTLLTAFSANTY
jgi:hypothetical protein